MSYDTLPTCITCGRQFLSMTIFPKPKFCSRACSIGYKDVEALQYKAGDLVRCVAYDVPLTVVSASDEGVLCTWTQYGHTHRHTVASADLELA
jgi:hypothetical protein